MSVGANAVSVVVTAEDGETTQTYTVTVTRAEPLSTDATLRGLTLSGVDFGAFDPAVTEYAADVANDVSETTVTATTHDDGATYAIKRGGVTDDGDIPLAVGQNVITVEVTAEDGETAKTYMVTVTRAGAPAPEPAVAIELSSGSVEEGTEIGVTMSFANLTPDNEADLVFRADVLDSDDENADGCEGGGLGKDRYFYLVDEDPEVREGTISASCPAGEYTLRVGLSSADNTEASRGFAAPAVDGAAGGAGAGQGGHAGGRGVERGPPDAYGGSGERPAVPAAAGRVGKGAAGGRRLTGGGAAGPQRRAGRACGKAGRAGE